MRVVHPMFGAWREVFDVARARTPTHSRLRDRLAGLVLTTVVVDLVASLLVWRLERHAPQTDIHGFGDALFWTSSQLSTVSSSMKNPLSTGARVLDVALEVYAITVVTAMAGSFASFLHVRGRERDAAAATAAPAPGPG
jgi:hypothetical protein